jgi:hypothetical protein
MTELEEQVLIPTEWENVPFHGYKAAGCIFSAHRH